jgi:stage V sporulation protein D (sporulation-specific penicillin-binding protein)
VAFKDLSYDAVSDYMDYIKTDEGECVVGVVLEENYDRTYPNKTAACQLIGYTSSGNVGNWGLEQQYNDVLNGTQGRQYSYMSDDGTLETETHDAVDGNTIVSTIDLNIQNIVDDKIAAFMDSVGAKNVSVLVMDPNNAEVLAMGNSKTFDLNNPYDTSVLEQTYTDEEIAQMSDEETLSALNDVWRNFIISDTYEPGSTFKPFTMCAALEEGIVQDGDQFYCSGLLHVGDYDIKCHNTDGWVDIEHAIAKSCNVSMMQINAKMGKEKYVKYQSIFGFGQYTNIDLPGEASAEGLVYTLDNIGETELATSSFGQGLNCSMIQLATGFCSLINGGNYYEPHVVKEIRNSEGGTVQTIEKKLVKKTVSKTTSKLIKKYLKTVVDEGTGTGCQIAGYEIGGKTGTAEKLPRNANKYLLSFIGFAPYENPEVLVYVTVDEINLTPQDQTSYAVHLARQILKEILPYMGVQQEEVSDEESEDEVVNVNEDGTVMKAADDAALNYLNDVETTEEESTQAEDSTQDATQQEISTEAQDTAQTATTEETVTP